ncbi:MAG: T9SS type A sorting domain-containing protein, partial [Psychroflexus sp.]|nr:T9SS type A sorting domain-containing protein [Psychroflexus sp.]
GKLFNVTYTGFSQLYVSSGSTINVTENIPVYANENVVNYGSITLADAKSISLTLDAGLDNSQGSISFNDATLVIGSGGANASSTDDFVFNTNDQVKHVVLNKTGGTTNVIGGHLGISETLKLESGTLTAGDKVTMLNPNENEVAYVIESTGGNANLAVEKYYPAKRAFRMVASPVDGVSIFDNWQNAGVNDAGIGTHITGGVTSLGFDQTVTDNPSMFEFVTGTGWQAIANTNATNLEVGVPYRLMVRGDRTVDLTDNDATPTTTTLISTGDLEVGNTNITFPSATAGSNTFAFIANPYQSRIDVSEVLAANSSKADDTKLWVWDPMINTRGGFVTIDQFSSGNGTATPFVAGENSSATKFIEPGQAFFIQLSGSDSNISFTESVKDVSNLSQSPESLSQQPQLLFNLHDEDQEVIDAIRLRFSPDGNNDIDQFDISKLGNMDENLASVNGNSLFTIQKRSLPETDEEIPLFTNNWRNENYSFTANLNNLEATDVYLVDHYLGTETLLANGDTYNFSVDANISESVNSLRFALKFDNETMGIDEQENSFFSLYPNPAKDIVNIQTNLPLGSQAKVEVYNMLGQLVISQTQAISHTSLHIGVNVLEAGVYLVKLTGQDGYSQTQELIKE